MPTTQKQDEHFKKIRNEATDYEQTVDALLAFAALVVHDGSALRAEARFGFGRRMDSTTGASSDELHPDLVAQMSKEYGIVAEAKKSLGKDHTRWNRHLAQIRKYDDALQGWWTASELIESSNTILLLHQSRSRVFGRLMASEAAARPESVGPSTALIEFSHVEESSTFVFFRLELGKLSDPQLQGRLDQGVQVPLDRIKMSFPNVKYYDADAPLVIVLAQLWMDVFPSLLQRASYDDKLKVNKIPVSADEVANELQQAYGSGALYRDKRSSQFPHRRSVVKGLDWLVHHKLALPPVDGSTQYTILYKGFRTDVREKFARMEATQRSTAGAPDSMQDDQMPLFD